MNFTQREAALYIFIVSLVWVATLWIGANKPLAERCVIGLIGILNVTTLGKIAREYGEEE